MTEPYFGIRIQTCNRKKGKPIKSFVSEAISCVKMQTYKNWKVFLTGDRYEPHEEFLELAKMLPPEKIIAVNRRNCPIERDLHKGYDLWCCGGVGSINYTLDLMVNVGITHCANFDDDDIWFPRHLEFHANVYRETPSPVLVVSGGHFKIPNHILPYKHQTEDGKQFVYSIAANCCNCSCTWDIQKMGLRAVNTVIETPWAKACWDYWFWKNFEFEAVQKGYRMAAIPEITVFHRHTHLHGEDRPDKKVAIDMKVGQ